MSMTRRRGFTLIELLVVIAIIGILAAMLFPVFARARESARKVQCLSNVKNVAMAVQMYLADYQKFPESSETNADARAYFATAPGGGHAAPFDNCNRAPQANPYKRWHVIFDEYTKNKDVYRCPSAKRVIGANWIVPDYGQGYLQYLKDTQGKWGRARSGNCNGDCMGPCGLAWPPGWGGSVTDSVAQNAAASPSSGGAEISIAFTSNVLDGVTESRILDAAQCVVCGDSTIYTNILGPSQLVWEINSFCSTDGDHVDCGILDASREAEWNANPGFRSQYSRHQNGGNVGFADGHAKWMPGQTLVDLSPYCECCSDETGGSSNTIHTKDRPLRGFCPVSVDAQ